MADRAPAAGRRVRRLVLATCVAVTTAAGGCAGDGPPPDGGDGAFDAIQTGIFDVACLGSGCHTSGSAAGGLVLEAGLSYAALVGVPPGNPAARARGLLRVRPFNPAGSFLLAKLTDPGSGEGARMPLGGGALPAESVEQVRAWILAGAPPPASRALPPAAVAAGIAPLGPTPTPSPTPSPGAAAPAGSGPFVRPAGPRVP